MRWFWDVAIRPLLVALDPQTIVEIGADEGATSRPLLEFAIEREALVHIVDPAPRFDEGAMKARFGDHLRMHRAKSLDALEEIGPVDAVLIDGDHNWYTVFHELKGLDAIGVGEGRPFPVVFMHDVGWPYGRRDMYYDPDLIPAPWRQPWARRPVVWGQGELGMAGGLNGSYANALEEGTPRNGVLTALEDFLEESEQRLAYNVIEGLGGLGILIPESTLDEIDPLQRQWENLSSPEFLRTHIRRLAGLLAASVS